MFCFLFFPVCNPLVATRNKDTKLLLLFLNEQKKSKTKNDLTWQSGTWGGAQQQPHATTLTSPVSQVPLVCVTV
jgi:hypothetical protein